VHRDADREYVPVQIVHSTMNSGQPHETFGKDAVPLVVRASRKYRGGQLSLAPIRP
jgi:hypothetical protein